SAMRHGVPLLGPSARRTRLDLSILLCQAHGNFHEYVLLAPDRPALTYLYQHVPRIDAEQLRRFIGMKPKTRVNSRIPHGQTGFTDAHRFMHNGSHDVFGNVHDLPEIDSGAVAKLVEHSHEHLGGGVSRSCAQPAGTRVDPSRPFFDRYDTVGDSHRQIVVTMAAHPDLNGIASRRSLTLALTVGGSSAPAESVTSTTSAP